MFVPGPRGTMTYIPTNTGGGGPSGPFPTHEFLIGLAIFAATLVVTAVAFRLRGRR